MRGHRILIALDETLAGDELDRVTRFLNDVGAVYPIASVSGLIRHVEQRVPITGTPILCTGLAPMSETGVSQVVMRYIPCQSVCASNSTGILESKELREHLSQILARCSLAGDQIPGRQLVHLMPNELGAVQLQYDVVVCVRPIRGEGACLTHGDQLVCQLAASGQRPIWRCPRRYVGIHRVVVAWPNVATGRALLAMAARLAELWDLPISVLSVGSTRHQSSVNADIETANISIAFPWCELLACDRFEDIARCIKSDDLLVMGAYGRWWPWRLFSASHTETILQDLVCSALLFPGHHESTADCLDTGTGLRIASSQPRNEAANARATR